MCVVALPIGCARMGAVTSRRRQGESSLGSWGWHGPPGEHSPYPVDLVAYPGDELLYCYLDIIAKYKIMRNTVNLGPSVVTTDIDDYLHELNQCYDRGFTLNHFVKVPGVKTTIQVQNWADPHPYQAILSRPAHRNIQEKWELKIEKQILSTRLLATAEFEEEKDLINTIHENAERGARLVSAQTIGYVRSGTSNDQYVVMGVDLFFNIPRHPLPCRYVYHTIHVPVRYIVVPDSTQTVQQIECDADWMGQLKLFLDKGWKLVDICIDTTALADAFGMKTSSKQIDTIWVFEKPVDKMNCMEPLYEGVILEYYHKTKRFVGEERPCKDWRPVIAGMGVTGWELTTIIQTPYLSQSTFTTYTMKLLMIFQRPIVIEHQKRTRDLLLQHAREAFEQEQLSIKGNKLVLSKSNSVPGTSMHSLYPGPSARSTSGGNSPKPGYRSRDDAPATKRYVYADQAVLGGINIPNGAPKGAGAEELTGGITRFTNQPFLHSQPVVANRGGRSNSPPPYAQVMRPSRSLSALRRLDQT